MDTLAVLKNLTAQSGVPGDEKKIADTLIEYLKPYGEAHTDALDSVICEIGEGDGGFMLDAHIDRVGLIVTHITEEGFLRVAACGGIDNRTLGAQQVTVHGKEDIKGVIISTPPHLQSGSDERKAMKADEALVDTGLGKAELEKTVSLGDRITVDSDFTELLGDRVSAPALDDRSGVAAILYALEILKANSYGGKITVCFSTREEVDEGGAKVAAFCSKARELIAVDVSFAKTPDSKAEDCGVMGKGPMIGVSSTLDYVASKKLQSVAAENNIPYQLEIMAGRTGTNADSMTVSAGGMISSLISIPLKYMHTGVEIVSISDVENVGYLIAKYILAGGRDNA